MNPVAGVLEPVESGCASRAAAAAPTPRRLTGLQVERLNVDDDRHCLDWARLLDADPEATIFHEPGWSRAARSAFGHPLHTLAVRRGGRLTGILPLVEIRSRLFGHRLISLPYATGGGILATDGESSAALAQAAESLAAHCRAAVVELRSRRVLAGRWRTVDRHVEFVRELPSAAGAVEAMLPRKARAAARQAREREGLRVRHADCDLALVWGLYSRSMRRLGSINYPRRFFFELAAAFSKRLWVTTVWKGRQPVGGVLSFIDRATIRPYFAGFDERLRCTGSANWLYLALMQRAAEAGLRYFDFGRTRADNHGSIEFKRNQGFEQHPLAYQVYMLPGRPPLDLSPGNPRFALARRLWTRLPLALTRPLGAWLARSIPG